MSVERVSAVIQSTSKLHKSSNFILKCFKLISMQPKILLIALSAAAFSSCSTAYKAGQTPDDVYYSPVKVYEERQDEKRYEEKTEPARDYQITMSIRDYRWRDYSDDYSYNNSPYNYAICKTYNYGYYYNPYYYPWAIYTGKVIYSKPNTTPRMVNLNAYNGYNTKVATSKTNGTNTWVNPSYRYNNTNSTESPSRQILYPSSGSSNNTRSYSPSSSGSSGSSSSGSSSSGSSVSRPGRGG